MTEQNYPKFRALLRGAICTRTQAQFANESGLSAEHLNRMLNSKTIHRPSKSTLHKIAAAAKNGITFQTLCETLDMDEPDSQTRNTDQMEKLEQAQTDFQKSFSEKATETMECLSKKLSAMQYPIMHHSLETFVQMLFSGVEEETELEIVYEMSEERPYYGKNHPYADKYVSVCITMADNMETASSNMIVYFTEIPYSATSACFAIQNASIMVDDIMDLFGMPPCVLEAHGGQDNLEEAMRDPFYLHIEPVEKFKETYHAPGATAEERLLHNIFGKKYSYTKTLEGIGFWLPDDFTENFMTFLKEHMKGVLQPYDDEPENRAELEKRINQAVTENNPQELAFYLQEIDYVDDLMENDTGWGAALAHIMEQETGFPYRYHKATEDDSFSNLSKNSCIILEEHDQEEHRILRETALTVTASYVRKLGLKTFGDILFTNVVTAFRKPMTYVLNDRKNEDTESENAVYLDEMEYNGTLDNPPKENGIYAVKLKDGRFMRCFYMASNNFWIMGHMEWSHMIEAYCPTRIQEQATDEEVSDN